MNNNPELDNDFPAVHLTEITEGRKFIVDVLVDLANDTGFEVTTSPLPSTSPTQGGADTRN